MTLRPRLPPAVFLLCLPVFCAPAAPGDRVDFDRQIRPLLSDKCFACHGPDGGKRVAALRLDTKDGGAFSERRGVKIIAPGDPGHSRLYQRISAEKPATRMPPPASGLSLTKEQIALIGKWIEQGAEWRPHWSFIAPRRPETPIVSRPDWVRNPIDAFILARLEREGLKPSPEAAKTTLIRRVSLDLTGLPPTPAEVHSFVADKSSDAYEKLVDRLLHSPRYGERMAMQWLDLARYADTHGYHIDSHREMWHWRDWVIDAFNRNMPYDQFTVEQLAGDLLPQPTVSQRVATGFNRNHMINFEGGAIPEEYQTEYVVDRVEATATTWLGLTVGCARCHDHKYDPISQKEFYQFYAFFNTIDEKGLDGRRGNAEPLLKLPWPGQKERLEFLTTEIAAREKAVAEAVVDPIRLKWEPEYLASLPATPRDGLLAWYELDGNLSDITGNYRHGRVVKGNPGYGPGIAGNSADFDGQTQVTLGRVSLDSAKPFSLSLWLRASGSRRNPILTQSSPDGSGIELGLDDYVLTDIQQRSPRLFARIGNEKSGIEVTARDRFIPSLWYHVGMSYDGSGKAAGVKLYINGIPALTDVVSDSLRVQVRNDAPLEIGNSAFGPRFRGKLDDLRVYSRVLAREEFRVTGVYDAVRALLETPPEKRSVDQRTRLGDYFLSNEASAELQRSWAELKTLTLEKTALEDVIPNAMVMAEMKKPRETAVLGRGDYRNRGEKVTPAVPSVLPVLPKDAPPNRLSLARWLVSPDHPLTARVAVNRYWQLYFGNGLVKTTQDFGSQGDPPVNPELLDWLATEFIRSGWDIRAMQRLIVTSAAYRQSSAVTPELLEKDPENRLVARGPRYRLSAEIVRDNALFASGLLKERTGGASVFPYQPAGLWEETSFGDGFSAQSYTQSQGDDLYRRSMYTFWKRTSPPPSLVTFDAPDREKCTAKRGVTNTPLQALVLLNDPTYIEAARMLAQRMLIEARRDPASRIGFAFQLALGRKPVRAEVKVLEKLAARELADCRKDPDRSRKLITVGESKPDERLRPEELAAWTTVASAILNLDETITKE